MTKFSLCVTLFSTFVSLIFSEQDVPLRGTLKNVHKESLITENNKENFIGVPRKEGEESVIQNYFGNFSSDVLFNNTKEDNLKTRSLLDTAKTVYLREVESSEVDGSKCESSFTMWFDKGVVITTIECGTYSTIYSGKKDGSPQPKYIKGKVNTVEVESDDVVKINGQALSGISVDVGSPSENTSGGGGNGGGGGGGGRLLTGEDSTEEVAKVYSFPVGKENFDVYLPKKSSAAQRTKYSLAHNDKIFFSNSEAKSEYTLKEDGDLVNSSQDVILDTNPPQEDSTTTEGSSNGNSTENSTSSAFKLAYIVPSLAAALASLLLF